MPDHIDPDRNAAYDVEPATDPARREGIRTKKKA
jgi:hypothetical protein